MSAEDFESIVERQIPSDEWYDSGCAENFPHIEPLSDVGEAFFQLAVEHTEANRTLEDRRALSVRGLPFEEGEFEELDELLVLASDRCGVACGIYDSIRALLMFGDSQGVPVSFDQAVVSACNKKEKSIKENHYNSWQKKENLIALTNEVGMMFRLEANLHFQNLAPPPA